MKMSQIFISSFRDRVISKLDLTQFEPPTDYLLVHKRTKSENILDLNSCLNFRLTKVAKAKQRNLAGLKKTAVQFQKRNNIVVHGAIFAKKRTYFRKMFRSSVGRFEV